MRRTAAWQNPRKRETRSMGKEKKDSNKKRRQGEKERKKM
jgi:hypothetical protein